MTYSATVRNALRDAMLEEMQIDNIPEIDGEFDNPLDDIQEIEMSDIFDGEAMSDLENSIDMEEMEIDGEFDNILDITEMEMSMEDITEMENPLDDGEEIP